MCNYAKIMMVLIACMVLLSGCAKKEIVKNEGVIQPGQESGENAAKMDKGDSTDRESVADTAVGEEQSTGRSAVSTLLETVYFDFDSYLLSSQARDILSRNADWLKKNPKVKVQIEGHCDERGSDAYNLALGERRAKSVLQYLLNLGIDDDRLTAISFGEERPATDGHDESAWSKNRRAELISQD